MKRSKCVSAPYVTPPSPNLHVALQPYKDQAAEARKKFEQDRMEWFTKTDPRILRALNMQRRAKNLPLVHVPAGVRPKRPMGSYMLYVSSPSSVATA